MPLIQMLNCHLLGLLQPPSQGKLQSCVITSWMAKRIGQKTKVGGVIKIESVADCQESHVPFQLSN